MTKEELIGNLTNAVVTYKRDEAAKIAQQILDEGVDPLEAINEGLLKGVTLVGDLYSKHQAYLPQLLAAGATMYSALDVLLPAIPQSASNNKKTVTLAVVEGDVHDIGKNIYKTLLIAAGFNVVDLGKDVSAETISEAIESNHSEYLSLSALMTSTMFLMKDSFDLLTENGYRENITITVGGSPTSPEFAKSIGADHWDKNAQNAVQWIKSGAE
ncbi:MAG: corrinoid protein [Candidatus Methanomethylophilaceae archaeon]|nr:corrinoid protein [Candidatus Methanomethylophilaceae archaeon]MBP5684948.1 corrinoid protein [Candidatus Methanomethylophilaceae archaeon]MBP5735425.1 corrinoid protein [Candidatus Methanomethylophilaceae archaeon]